MSEADELFDQLARRLRVIGVHFGEAADELIALRKAVVAEQSAAAAQPPAPLPPHWQQPGPPGPGPQQQWPGPAQQFPPQQWPGPQPPQQPR